MESTEGATWSAFRLVSGKPGRKSARYVQFGYVSDEYRTAWIKEHGVSDQSVIFQLETMPEVRQATTDRDRDARDGKLTLPWCYDETGKRIDAS